MGSHQGVRIHPSVLSDELHLVSQEDSRPVVVFVVSSVKVRFLGRTPTGEPIGTAPQDHMGISGNVRAEKDLPRHCSMPFIFRVRTQRPQGKTGTGPVGGRPELPVLGLLVIPRMAPSRGAILPPPRRWPQNIVSAVSGTHVRMCRRARPSTAVF